MNNRRNTITILLKIFGCVIIFFGIWGSLVSFVFGNIPVGIGVIVTTMFMSMLLIGLGEILNYLVKIYNKDM